MRSPAARAIGIVAALLLAAVSCTIELGTPDASPSPVRSPDPSPSPVPTGEGSSAAVMAELCDVPPPPKRRDPKPAGDTPPEIALVERQIEEVRGLRFRRPVAIQAVSADEIERRLTAYFEKNTSVASWARRSNAWGTIGVVPPGTDVREALAAFQSGGVVGYYNPANQALVYIGQDELTTTARYILAHELTHAIDDQYFDLTRLDPLTARCDDEALMAGLGAVEGSAQFFAAQAIIRFPDATEEFGGVDAGSTEDVPPFVVQTQLWPYDAGMRFIEDLEVEGGVAAVDAALEHLPVSTEQVIHPERYPNDTPQPVDIPDLAPDLGGSWVDLDVMIVGEAWLRIMLGLRLDDGSAQRATAGWDGGLYRAWSDGDRVALVLETAWDSRLDAEEFADALGEWLDGEVALVADPAGRNVVAFFATDPVILEDLRDAVG